MLGTSVCSGQTISPSDLRVGQTASGSHSFIHKSHTYIHTYRHTGSGGAWASWERWPSYGD
ncbi:hypothetical protein BDQ94DRAFT_145520 [Aspergillus welwitschiae]|uniref:Uncharacterized protein n=1 Tax=Aspergillus welwitschiae TaxID=1341132 RepID=A0A3F3PYY0_9EURO|nr:hypothetical protein BDQ94DRAFT_145520 [Aspergillus welwitschiae]RDH32143.1 hypothetical protein BDQ94DRAFT_145520 [Aspergillus welwitschiae]